MPCFVILFSCQTVLLVKGEGVEGLKGNLNISFSGVWLLSSVQLAMVKVTLLIHLSMCGTLLLTVDFRINCIHLGRELSTCFMHVVLTRYDIFTFEYCNNNITTMFLGKLFPLWHFHQMENFLSLGRYEHRVVSLFTKPHHFAWCMHSLIYSSWALWSAHPPPRFSCALK